MLKGASSATMQHHVKQGLTLCHHALVVTCMQGSPEDVEGAMASIFVWLRYSSARHLTWQRNYNTQPRILGEAQAKLTHKITEVHPLPTVAIHSFTASSNACTSFSCHLLVMSLSCMPPAWLRHVYL